MREHQTFECNMLRKLNPRIEELTAQINAERDPSEKARLAQELEQEVDVLLDCANHQAGRLECQSCRLIAGLRQKATRLVRAAGQISRLHARAGR